MPETAPVQTEPMEARIGLWDAVSIIVGIVVGVMIFSEASPIIFSNVAGPWQGMGVWLLAGVLSLVGALCYSELATTYPRSGGDYNYLTRAFGPPAGFLFGWAQLAAVMTGSIGVVAYVFADYTVALWGMERATGVWFAVGAVLVLTVMNVLGVVLGKTTQNVLTAAKVIGVAGVAAAGLIWGGAERGLTTPDATLTGPGFGLAMIMALYAYGGWNDSVFVAAEVRDRRRNLPCALVLGTVGITLIYLLVNAGYLWGLGLEGLRGTATPAADVAKLAMGDWGSRAMSLLVMVSALGAMNGLILTGSRVYAAVGADYRVLAVLGRWNRRLGTPVWSLAAQAAVSLGLILAVGTATGRGWIDAAVRRAGLAPMPWERYGGGFDTLFSATAPVFWAFFLLTGLSVFVLRAKDRRIERPFPAPLYPFTPLVFCLTCGYMLYASIDYARGLALLGIVPVLLGVPLYLLSQRRLGIAPK